MPILFSVWIPGQGWLKANNACVAFEQAIVAQATADRCGHGARVEYIDDSLEALEPYFLSLEKLNKERSRNFISWITKFISWITKKAGK
jgi:hypothetical protein